MKTLITLDDLPAEMTHLVVVCSRCPRNGRLSLARLRAEHGPTAALKHAIGGIHDDCPKRNAHALMERCDVHSPALSRIFARQIGH